MGLLERAAAVRADSRILRLTARSLLAHGRTLRLPRGDGPHPADPGLLERARVDAAVVAALVTPAWLCADCIAQRAKLTLAQVADGLGRIGSTMKVEHAVAPCGACAREGSVRRLA